MQDALGALSDSQLGEGIWKGWRVCFSESQELEAHPVHWVLLAMAMDPGMSAPSSIQSFLFVAMSVLDRSVQIQQQNFP
jgi:hypothetical protein